MYATIKHKYVRTEIDHDKADLFAASMLKKLGGKNINYMKLMKLLYFADRYHVREYLRPIAKDDYFAMKNGIIGSYWLDLLRGRISSKYFTSDRISTVTLINIPQKDDEVQFSESELEALNFAFEKFSKYNENQLVDIIHQYPEWSKFENRFKGLEGREDINLKDIFNDPEDNPIFQKYQFKDPFHSLSEEDKNMAIEALEDYLVESL